MINEISKFTMHSFKKPALCIDMCICPIWPTMTLMHMTTCSPEFCSQQPLISGLLHSNIVLQIWPHVMVAKTLLCGLVLFFARLADSHDTNGNKIKKSLEKINQVQLKINSVVLWCYESAVIIQW